MASYEAEKLKQVLELQPHPNGNGAFKELYRCSDEVATGYSAGTGIYYLLQGKKHVGWQILHGHDEMLVYHQGESVRVHTISKEGIYKCELIGNPLVNENAKPQVLLPRDTWMAYELAYNQEETSYVLLGAFVWPGYEYKDCEQATVEDMKLKFPHHTELIEKLAGNWN